MLELGAVGLPLGRGEVGLEERGELLTGPAGDEEEEEGYGGRGG